MLQNYLSFLTTIYLFLSTYTTSVFPLTLLQPIILCSISISFIFHSCTVLLVSCCSRPSSELPAITYSPLSPPNYSITNHSFHPCSPSPTFTAQFYPISTVISYSTSPFYLQHTTLICSFGLSIRDFTEPFSCLHIIPSVVHLFYSLCSSLWPVITLSPTNPLGPTILVAPHLIFILSYHPPLS